jgi:SpoVK/Ycf46/Vps4 family AAA+-type ATPase
MLEKNLTDKGKEIFLEDDVDLFSENAISKNIITPENITVKHLFFDNELRSQLDMVRNSLLEENYKNLRSRLMEKSLSPGIAVLLYGAPGTGKTESVMQIAHETGRSIIHVDISQTKSCWFGESEKIIKDVFSQYKCLCRKSKLKPILFFNEADAIFSKRKDSNSSNVAQTENTIQNIILEELEQLDGILVATTNLATNLDRAFERRFLFKIKFNKPSEEAKLNIWKDKLPILNSSEARTLASTYDFSGGEIDNIVRKATMKELLEGHPPSLDTLLNFCQEEHLTNSSTKKIGFA